MILKIKELFLLIFLILLQSCSGGRIGNFLESSFENIEEIESKDVSKIKIKNKRESNFEETSKEKNKNKNIEEIESKDVSKIKIKNKRESNFEETSKEKNKNIQFKKFEKKRKFKPQSYKIIFILKDVDPKAPIDELSTILRDYDINFEIEKIERFLDSNKKSTSKNKFQ